MAEGDDGAKKPAGAPRPKPPVPAAATAKPPVPTVAKASPPPPEENPFLPASFSKLSSSKIDAGWGAVEDVTDLVEPGSAQMPVAAAPSPPAPAPAVVAEPAKAEPVVAPKATPDEPPVQKRSRGKVAFVLLAAVALGGAGFAYQSEMAARAAREQAAIPPATQTTAEPVFTTEPPPPPTHTADPPPSAAASEKKPAMGGPAAAASIDPAARAYLDATQVPPGRKIVVDGRVVGTSPRKLAVRCGAHRIQIGDQDPESVDFPCGGEVNFTE